MQILQAFLYHNRKLRKS